MKKLYFDYNATTPVLPEVFDAMTPHLQQGFGNPGSPHGWGLEAREALDKAREQVAALVGAEPDEIHFTACATESSNMVIQGMFRDDKSGGLITSQIEHPATLGPAAWLEGLGVKVTRLEVDDQCLVNPDRVAEALEADTRLVSIMLANNETGTVQPIEKISRTTAQASAYLHADAAQALGKIPVNVNDLGVDFMTIAGHKLYAPKGVGALYIRKGVELPPIQFGGGQEAGLRPGTENIALIAGLGKACEIACRDLETEEARQRGLGKLLLRELESVEHLLHCPKAPRLPNTMAIAFPGKAADRIVEGLALEDVGVSPGAACHATETKISHVLEAMRVPEELAMGTIRFSWGRLTTAQDVVQMVGRLKTVLAAC